MIDSDFRNIATKIADLAFDNNAYEVILEVTYNSLKTCYNEGGKRLTEINDSIKERIKMSHENKMENDFLLFLNDIYELIDKNKPK